MLKHVEAVSELPAGESAGLRIPRAGLDQARRPCWLALGALFCSARPDRAGSGADAVEAADGVPVPVARLVGADALERASFLKRIKREEKYESSSLQALLKPPPTGAPKPPALPLQWWQHS